jgi:N-acetylmuramoyl-L-alanine amidase
MPIRLIECPSPNHDARPDGAAIDMLVLHYTGMQTADEALDRLCNPAAKVSSHYTIDRTGRIWRHVPEERRAWHAGVSFWAGEKNVNGRSIGIELVNPGHEFGYVPFTQEQIAALIGLAHGILQRHPIVPGRVLGHSDVAPSRKTDPGELFPWQTLAAAGIGLWPGVAAPAHELRKTDEAAFAASLARFGYGVPPQVSHNHVIKAFQRHFRPSCIDGVADAQCEAILTALLSR